MNAPLFPYGKPIIPTDESGAIDSTAPIEGLAVVKLETLARETSMSVKTLRKQIEIAERGGWLKVIRFSRDCYGFVPTIPAGSGA